jgi:pyruvate,water dikinase
LREDTHFMLTLPVPILRRVFLEMGRRLTELGIVQLPSDVFHLRFSELEQLATAWPPQDHQANYLRQVVTSRTAKRESLAGVPVMAIPLRFDAALGSRALVSGMAGSPGVAEGPVRRVRDVSAFGTVQPGDVLVAPYTNPSWTPLFRWVAAVVVDAGSSVSHAAIVARESGIPAVMGTGNAMQVLQDGQLVIVDGTRGIVLPASAQGEDAPS